MCCFHLIADHPDLQAGPLRQARAPVLHEANRPLASLVLAETSGTEAASTKVALFDGQGTKPGETTATVARYGVNTIDLSSIAGGASVNGGRIEITPQSGGGWVTGTLLMLDAALNSGSTMVSQPVASAASSTAMGRISLRGWPRR